MTLNDVMVVYFAFFAEFGGFCSLLRKVVEDTPIHSASEM